MANSNFVVHNGLTVGPLTIDATAGNISTTGSVTATSFVGNGAALTGGYANSDVASYLTSAVGSIGVVTTANTAMKGYVDGQVTTVNSSITTANTAMKGYVDAQDTIISNSVTGANAAIVTANTALKGYTDGQVTTVTNAVNLKAPIASPTFTGIATIPTIVAGNISISATADAITSTGTLTLDPSPTGAGGLVVIQGNLQVTGTTTTINSATLDVADLNITVAKGAANAAAANGAGLTVDGASATMLYNSTTDTFNFNKGVVANVTGNASGSALTVTQAAQTAITSLGTLTALGVTGTVTAGAFSGPLTGAVTGNVTGNASGSALTVTQAAQTAITSLGTLTGLTVSGTIAANANNTINIGASGTTFATVYATTFSGVSTTAKYADLAENYQADAEYAPGTVVHFGGEFEVTACDTDGCTSVAGIVSTNPAHLMNTGLEGANVVAVALNGRVPCQVQGIVAKGDLMVSAGNGRARAEANPKVGSVIGKALANSEGDAVIEVVVGVR